MELIIRFVVGGVLVALTLFGVGYFLERKDF